MEFDFFHGLDNLTVQMTATFVSYGLAFSVGLE
jgi:hypothetical protein